MKITKHISFLFFLFFFQQINAQHYQILMDKNHSSISAAESLTSLYRSIYGLEEKIFPKKIGEKIKRKGLKKNTNRAFRLGKGILFDFPLMGLFTVSQHEIFGHGYQYRLFGYSGNSYNINIYPPYGKGSGFAARGSLDSPRKLSKHESIAIFYGGAEAVKILSNTITKKWVFSDSIHYKEAILGVGAFGGPNFAVVLLDEITPQSVDDISRYLVRVNNYYGFSGINNHKLTRDYIRKKALISLLNPFIGFSFFSGFVNYGLQGKTFGKLYWLKIGPIKYLPSFRFGLAPFGDETIFESFIKKENKAVRIYYRHGNPVFEKFNGFGIETMQIINFSNKVILDFNLDAWNQPELELGGEEIRMSKKGFGGLVKMNFQVRLWEKPTPVFWSGQIGYKTDGYIEGEPLSKGIIFRSGIAYDF